MYFFFWQNVNSYGKIFLELISAIALQRPVVILLDGLDHIRMGNLDWIPWKLPSNAKLIITARTDSFLYHQFQLNLQTNKCFVEVSRVEKFAVFTFAAI